MNWEQAKRELDKTYRYHLNHRNLMAIRAMDVIYSRYQSGERSTDLYRLILSTSVEEERWREVRHKVW